MSKPVKKITVFVVITFALSSAFYVLSIRENSVSKYAFPIMWCPGIAAIVTQLIFERSLRDMGWKFRPIKYQLASYLTPLAYVLVAYLLLWSSGLGRFAPKDIQQVVSGQLNLPESLSLPAFVLIYFLVVATLVVLTSMITALGEEIGWRGLLVPELAKITSYSKTSLISGIIWAVYHMPVLLFADYNNEGSPVWYSLICFTIMVIAICFAFTWLRLKSGSLWTAAILHAAHNAFIQAFFTPMTADTGYTAYFIDEFGLLLVLTTVIAGTIFWRKRNELPTTGAVVAS